MYILINLLLYINIHEYSFTRYLFACTCVSYNVTLAKNYTTTGGTMTLIEIYTTCVVYLVSSLKILR